MNNLFNVGFFTLRALESVVPIAWAEGQPVAHKKIKDLNLTRVTANS